MKNIIEYILEIMTYEQKKDLYEKFNGANFTITDFELWIDYYLKHEYILPNDK